jgi:hypothetical protein
VTKWGLCLRWNYRIPANSRFEANDLQIQATGSPHGSGSEKMNGFAKDGGKRPSAAPAQIGRVGFFCAEVSLFCEATEKNDCFITSP